VGGFVNDRSAVEELVRFQQAAPPHRGGRGLLGVWRRGTWQARMPSGLADDTVPRGEPPKMCDTCTDQRAGVEARHSRLFENMKEG
jgi:hypothetical protein